MPDMRYICVWLAALTLGAAGLPEARAQSGPTPPLAPLPAPTMPGRAAALPTPTPTAAPTPPAGGCTCGNRRGLSRWYWHRTQCKRHLQESFIGFAEEFNEWPLGEAEYAHARTQVANGKAARMILNHYDFVDGTAKLNVRGQDKLAMIAATLPTSFYPVIVERTPKEPGLDQERKATVLAQLAQGPFPIPSERIVIGPRIPNGMTGYEAGYGIWPRQFGNLASGGAIGQASSTSFVGGGLDFSSGGLSGGAVGGLVGGAAGGLSGVSSGR